MASYWTNHFKRQNCFADKLISYLDINNELWTRANH